MKKILLAVILFSFFTAIPSFAMKLIINKDSDRTVPSRSIGSFDDIILDEEPGSDFYDLYKKNVRNGVFVIPGYQAEMYETYFVPRLKRDMRKELIGTNWKYPNYIALKAQYEENLKQAQSKKYMLKEKDTQNKIVKRYAREAADYYYRDTLKNPDKIIPSGFDIVIE